MELLAHARIVIWEGGALWVVDATTPAAPGRSTDLHAHHAIQITISLGGHFRLTTSDDHMSGDAVAVAADAGHTFQAEGLFAILFAEPESRLGRAIAARFFSGKSIAAIPRELLGDFPQQMARVFGAGVFEVSKPYLDRDATNLFRPVGRIRNRGLEASISGTPIPALTVVAGAVLIQSRVSGLTVDSGLIGSVTPGVWARVLSLSLQYGPRSWNGLSLETDVEHRGDYFADRRNTFKVPGETMINIGARYRFDIGEYPANFRLRVENATNVYNWHVHSSAGGWFHPQARRRYSARLAVDF